MARPDARQRSRAVFWRAWIFSSAGRPERQLRPAGRRPPAGGAGEKGDNLTFGGIPFLKLKHFVKESCEYDFSGDFLPGTKELFEM